MKGSGPEQSVTTALLGFISPCVNAAHPTISAYPSPLRSATIGASMPTSPWNCPPKPCANCDKNDVMSTGTLWNVVDPSSHLNRVTGLQTDWPSHSLTVISLDLLFMGLCSYANR